jgi:hypothetical protein
VVDELNECLEGSHIPLLVLDEHEPVPLQDGGHSCLLESVPKLVVHLCDLVRHEHVEGVALDLRVLVLESLSQDLVHVEYLAHVLEVAVHNCQGSLIE